MGFNKLYITLKEGFYYRNKIFKIKLPFYFRCDVTKREEVLQVNERIKKEVGDVTVLINNAGIMPCHRLLEHKPQEIIKMFEVNVFAHFWVRLFTSQSFKKKKNCKIMTLNDSKINFCFFV